MVQEAMEFSREAAWDVNTSINMKAKAVAGQPDVHAATPRPIVEVDEAHTIEDEFQLATLRAAGLPAPERERSLEGLYAKYGAYSESRARAMSAKYDEHAQARATGVEPQTYDEFERPMGSRAQVSEAFYAARHDGRKAVEIFDPETHNANGARKINFPTSWWPDRGTGK